MVSKLGAYCAAAAFACAAPASAQQVIVPQDDANPSISIALTWVFGKGAALGIKAFSTDREGDGALTLGIDYLFNDRSWRPNIGAAYIDDGGFIDLNLGFGLGGGSGFGGPDFGVSVGPIDSSSATSGPPGGGNNP